MFDIGSFLRGLRDMKRNRGKVNYSIRLRKSKEIWFHIWTPVWHKGRGPYISLGLGVVAFYRGY